MKRIAFSCAAALFIATPSFADDADDLAVDCHRPQNWSERFTCADRDFAAADKTLNAVWKRARAAAVSMDKSFEENERSAEKALLKAQRAWIEYRDGQCEAKKMTMHGGTDEAASGVICMTELTERRTKELETFLNLVGE